MPRTDETDTGSAVAYCLLVGKKVCKPERQDLALFPFSQAQGK